MANIAHDFHFSHWKCLACYYGETTLKSIVMGKFLCVLLILEFYKIKFFNQESTNSTLV